MNAREAQQLAQLGEEMRCLVADMRKVVDRTPTTVAMAMKALAEYRNGERKPVEGPFTYVEALDLATLNQKLLDVLKEMLNAPKGSDAAARRAQAKAHYNAAAVVARAEAEL